MFDMQTRNVSAAERELVDCWHRFPRSDRAPFRLGLLYLSSGRETNALPPLQAAASLSPTDPFVQENTAVACFRVGRTQDAKRYALAAIRIDPSYADPYLLLAGINDHLGTADSALGYARTYLKLSPNPAPGYYLMARLYARRASGEEAEQWARRAVEAEPSNAEYWTTLGRVLSELRGATRAQEGLDCYRKALEIDPNSAAAHRYLGHGLLARHQYEDAVVHLRTALNGADDPAPVYYDLGQALMKAGHPEEGRKALARFQATHDYAAGIARLTREIAASPGERKRYYALARFYLKFHQYSAALNTLRTAAEKFGPDSEQKALYDQAQSDAAFEQAQRSAAAPDANPPVGSPGAPDRQAHEGKP